MDNIRDKLSQRWNAQEIIKANLSAEAEEAERLQNQMKEYQECLAQMRGICDNMQASSAEMEQHMQNVTAGMEQQLRENASGLEKILKERIEHLSEEAVSRLEETEKGISESVIRLQGLEESQVSQSWLESSMADQTAHIDDIVHKENVKVYRNVQAVVTEEAAKQTQEVKSSVNRLGGRLTAVLGVSIAALVMATAGLAFQLLTYFHVL